MKLIRSHDIPIFKSFCSCDEENVEFSLSRYSGTDNPILIKFSGEKNLSFRTRLRDGIKVFKTFEELKVKPWFGIYIENIDQLLEMYSELYRISFENNLLTKEDVDYINELKEPIPEKFYEHLNTTAGKDGQFVYFRSDEGFYFSAELREYDLEKEDDLSEGNGFKYHIYWFNFGWNIEHDRKRRDFIPYIRRFIFRNETFYMQDYEVSLSKSELVELLNVLNYFTSKFTMDSWMTIYGPND